MLKSTIKNAVQNAKSYLSYSAFALVSMVAISSCSDPSELATSPDSVSNGKGQEIAGRRTTTTTPIVTPTTQNTISFSGYTWNVRNTAGAYSGPGLNTFTNSTNNVWVDGLGQLHLKITYTNGKWVAAEIESQQSFGYGDYIFYINGRPDNLDQNVVFGLFTWNNNSFQTDANSEIDIEFAKWGYAGAKSLQYAVQPTNGGVYAERNIKPSSFLLTGDYSTHGFTWAPTEVIHKSYYDFGYPTAWLASQWSFSSTSQPRQKIEGGRTSDAVVIPKPGTDTKVHMNLWLNDTNKDGYGDAPSNGQTVEVIVNKFEFKPRVI